ncbi:exosortase F-associated protein [Chryseobacterium sp. BIGb0186]|uniref:exosortase F system-associated membrane protein n=1 Tax=Chryseobacterium sp. BIGb0186 TaxID=2940558 RepID=UPI00247333A2|nr:exosortase F system-associated protein [Chryseobacterium sp. BIGb0186]MDH6212085.1 exosortase F-associated protein [Chryseobacterium sp. BIGb0186]
MKILSWFLVIVGICGLVSVRILEDQIFYDPFLNYFHEADYQIAFPHFAWGKLIISHVFRFALNLFLFLMYYHSFFI